MAGHTPSSALAVSIHKRLVQMGVAALVAVGAGFGLAADARAATLSVSVGTFRDFSGNGTPDETWVASVPFDIPPPRPDLEVELPMLEQGGSFVPAGGTPVGEGTLQEGLQRQLPRDGPIAFDPAVNPQTQAEIGDIVPKGFDLDFLAGFDEAGLTAVPDPWMTLYIGYDDQGDPSTDDPLVVQHQALVDIVPLSSVQRTLSILYVSVVEGGGGGAASAVVTHTSFLGGLPDPVAGGNVFVQEPANVLMAWEGGPLSLQGVPTIDTMEMNVEIFMTPGDRIAIFAALLVVPEPATSAFLAPILLLAFRARRARG